MTEFEREYELLSELLLNEQVKDKVNSVLEQIRAEIEELDRYYDNDYFSTNNCPMYKCSEVLQIIDKYRTERTEE